jgi:hypothetical protein
VNIDEKFPICSDHIPPLRITLSYITAGWVHQRRRTRRAWPSLPLLQSVFVGACFLRRPNGDRLLTILPFTLLIVSDNQLESTEGRLTAGVAVVGTVLCPLIPRNGARVEVAYVPENLENVSSVMSTAIISTQTEMPEGTPHWFSKGVWILRRYHRHVRLAAL